MRAPVLALAIVTLGVATASLVEAACHWEWDCTNGYPCHQTQVCQSPIDLPALPQPGISPIPPPTIAPIPRPVIPPIGTSQCRPVYTCNRFNQCYWQTLCQ